MAKRYTRQEFLARLRAEIARGKPLVMTGAGNGIAAKFIERGGGVALQVLIAGSDVLRTLPEIFDEWIELLLLIAKQGNASLVAFVRGSPRFVSAIATPVDRPRAIELAREEDACSGSFCSASRWSAC